MIIQDVMEALEAGTFNSREDRHFSRTPLILDEQGWRDIASLLADTLDRCLEIQVENSSRLAKSNEKGILTKVDILHFESPEFGLGEDIRSPSPPTPAPSRTPRPASPRSASP